MQTDKTVRQANQIALFFASKPEAEAVAGVADHINRFWEPRMRSQLLELLDAGDPGFHPLVTLATPTIRPPATRSPG